MKTSLLHARQAKDAGSANTAVFSSKPKQEFTHLSATLAFKVPLDVYLKEKWTEFEHLFCKYSLTKNAEFPLFSVCKIKCEGE